MVNQDNEKFTAKDKMTDAQLIEFNKSTQYFSKFDHSHIHREENEYVDALLNLASTKDADLFQTIPIELFPKPSIGQNMEETLQIEPHRCKKSYLI